MTAAPASPDREPPPSGIAAPSPRGSAVRRRRVRVVLTVAVVCAVTGAVISSNNHRSLAEIADDTLSSALVGAAIAALEIYLQGPASEWLRRWPMLAALLLRTILYAALFLAAAERKAALPLFTPAPQHWRFVFSAGDLAVSMSIAFAINTVFILRRLLGGATLLALVTGRYHRPREEERVVLFLDLRDSTRLAERLGDARFHRFLNRIVFDLSEPVLEAGGEFYRYVGDEIIITWSMRRGSVRGGAMRRGGSAAARCIACVFAIEDALARRRAAYRREFAAEPRFRAALHAGPLIVGEMGDIRREIVLLGDTMNTAARIEEACRSTGHDIIASSAFMALAGAPPPEVRATGLGVLPIRGKTAGLALVALSR